MTILYPVAANAEQALARPLGRAARESEARRRAGHDVAFTTDPAGPAFPTREAALAAYADRLESPEAEDRFSAVARRSTTISKRPSAAPWSTSIPSRVPGAVAVLEVR